MLLIPVKPLANQTLQVQLSNQAVTLNIYQLAYGLFIDVFIGDNLIIGGVICENLNRIVRSAYLGFLGDLIFYDVEETSDPIYTGLGSRFQLLYLEPSDL